MAIDAVLAAHVGEPGGLLPALQALGLTVPHAALAPSGQPIWLDVARRTADAVHRQWQEGRTLDTVLTDEAIRRRVWDAIRFALIAAQPSTPAGRPGTRSPSR